jgi:transcriptional regulator with GAF, ATPase, and Fis domain
VVLKVVAPRDPAARARLIVEFERLASLDHPGLPEVVELGEVGGVGTLAERAIFLATELVPGRPAGETCAEETGTTRAALVAAVLADAADALAALHDVGLTHHDVKPAHLVGDAERGFRLLDLGLVRGVDEGDGTIHGTLPYLSPDALAGSTEPAVDLFALGVTGYELLTGRLPFAAADPAALLIAQATMPPVPEGPQALTSLLLALMAIDPRGRPSRARSVGEELARAGLLDERRAMRARAAPARLGRPGYVASPNGREATLAALAVAPSPVALVGPHGSGRSRLVLELERRRAIAALRDGRPRPPRHGPTLTDAAVQLGLAGAGPSEAARARQALAVRVLEACEARAAILHLVDPDPAVIGLIAGLPSERACVVLELDERAAAHWPTHRTRVDVPPLDDVEVLALSTRVLGAASATLARAAGRRARGRPGPLIDLLRAAHARRSPVTVEGLRDVRLEALDEELGTLVRGLPAPATELLAALALLDRPASPDELARAVGGPIAPALGALAAARLVDWQGARVVSDSQTLARAALAALADYARAALGGRLLAEADAAGALLEAAGLAHTLRRSDAPERAARAVRDLLAGALATPLMILDERVAALAATIPEPLGARLEGELLLRRAEYDRAAARLEAAAPSAEAFLLRARALRLAGRADQAAAVLGGVPERNEVGTGIRVLRARLLLDRGNVDEAAAALGVVDPDAAAPDCAEHAELTGLCALQRGDLSAARAAFVVHARLIADQPAARRARAEALLGMVAQAEGSLEDASAAYARALALAEEGGDPHGAAVYAQNLGGTLRELGELARAEAPLRRALSVLERVGRAEERALAWFNLGNLHRSLGDLEAAEQAAEAALALTGADADSRAALFARLLNADLARARGDVEAAIRAYRALTPSGPDAHAYVESALAEALAETDLREEARAAAERLARLGPELPLAARAHAALAEARARLVDPDPLPERLRGALTAEAAAAERAGRRPRALELEVVLATDAVRRGDLSEVRARLGIAHRAYEEILMRTPELRRAALREDPDVRRLHALNAALATPTADPSAQRLLEINKRLNSELDLGRLLELILDTVLELTRAERGFLLIRGGEGELEVRTERNVDDAARAGASAFSRSIAERAAQLGEPIVTVDAADDARFEAALSVSDLRLRSVLAVPLAVKGRVVGCVYVDHRARVGLFRPADVTLVAALAEQAAIAVENARLLAENRRRQAEVRALNEALTEKLATQTVELEGMHREVREARRRLGVRHDYSGLIGQTPRMLELFRLLDRVTDTALPVVIYGESGTGKELVARALHHNGPRRKAAFVSESCGAIPETLLEAALFGHVRGAFTGAQGERRGLFEIADGGTLFLDEVGEMSPAMQVRLLRVLQEGEFRRVGGEKLQKVDVRVVVASNRELGRMVEEGKFREDLFYRLNVVRVALPPLRERADDIPLLVEHFLSGRKHKGVTRRALERLARYRWPGNVRQLENELARAVSLADGPIDVGDLSPAVQAGTDAAEVDGPEPLDLRRRVERLERGLLEEALQRSAGNQSEAARLLGLSRFGLQKKLRRYRMRAVRP